MSEDTFGILRLLFAQQGLGESWRQLLATLEEGSLLRLNLIVKTGNCVLLVLPLSSPPPVAGEECWEFLPMEWAGSSFRQYFQREGVGGDLLDLAMDKLGFWLNSVAIYDDLQAAELFSEVWRHEKQGVDVVEGYLLLDFGQADLKVELPDWIYAAWLPADISLLPHLHIEGKGCWLTALQGQARDKFL